MLLPSECYVPSSNLQPMLAVSTNCELAAVTSLIYCLNLKFQLTSNVSRKLLRGFPSVIILSSVKPSTNERPAGRAHMGVARAKIRLRTLKLSISY